MSDIFTSNLPNDQDMIKALGSCAIPIPLDSGDCCFSGVGEDGKQVLVCVERKKVGDLSSCIISGRYLHQLQIAHENGADVFALIVEGRYRRNPDDGLLEVPVWLPNPRTGKRAEFWRPVQPTMMHSRFEQYLIELDYLAGVIVKRTENVRETADVIQALYTNFQTPPEQHNSFHQIFTAPSQRVELVRPGLVRRVAKELDGVGWKRSKAVADRFPTVKALVAASIEDWAKIEVESDSPSHRRVRLGGKTAEKIVKSLCGEGKRL